jgi:hypothetical protein
MIYVKSSLVGRWAGGGWDENKSAPIFYGVN